MPREEDSGRHYFNALKMYINERCTDAIKRKILYEEGLDILLDKYNLFLKEGINKDAAKNQALFFSMDELKNFLIYPYKTW